MGIFVVETAISESWNLASVLKSRYDSRTYFNFNFYYIEEDLISIWYLSNKITNDSKYGSIEG